MPTNQTSQVEFANKDLALNAMDELFNEVEQKRSGSRKLAPTPRGTAERDKHDLGAIATGRRKNIDRREDNVEPPGEERRQEDRRQKKAAAKTEAEKQDELEELKLQQHRKKILLAGCEPVMGFNYNYLAMDDYPENSVVAGAKRDRDYWLAVCVVFASIFLFGFMGLVSAGVAGIACGLGFISAIYAFSPFRRFFFSRPPLHVLLAKRKELEFRALSHIKLLEGVDGLAWRCKSLHKYNSNLSKSIFSGIYHHSKEMKLLSLIRQKKHIRLYLLLMIEAQKAYKRLEKDYLENHFKNLDAGIGDRLPDQETASGNESQKASGNALSTSSEKTGDSAQSKPQATQNSKQVSNSPQDSAPKPPKS